MFNWKPVDGADYYEVYSNRWMVGRIDGTRSKIIWETDTLSVGVAAVKDGVRGEITRVDVKRPEAPTDTVSPEPEPTGKIETPKPVEPAPPAPEETPSGSTTPDDSTAPVEESSEGA